MSMNNPARMYINRELEKTIIPFINRKEVISIIGARQSGKTTFIKHLQDEIQKTKKVRFLTFENRNDLALFQDNIDDFKNLMKNFDVVIIDEFQYAKEGGQKIKYLYDTTDIKFIISGSSSLELTYQTGKYMVGRMFQFLLTPFSFREFLEFQNPELFDLLNKKIPQDRIDNFNNQEMFGSEVTRRLSEQLEKFVVFGGYPAAVLAGSIEEKQKILSSIVDNYLLKDIKGLLNLASEDLIAKLSRLLATQIGNLVNYHELSDSSGSSYIELKKHLNILENTFIIKLIRPYYSNPRTELTKNPKVYFLDLGLRNYLLSDFRPIEMRNDTGALIENYAYILLNQLNLAFDLKFWRTKSKAEVDFIIEKEQKLIPIEVKYSSKPIIGKSLHSFIEKFNPPQAIILTKDYFGKDKIKDTEIKYIPLCYL